MGLRNAMLLLAGLLTCTSCEDPRERQSRAAVQQLVKATPTRIRAARQRVAALGRFALVDIEQELHGANVAVRLRLIAAIREIDDAEALPLLRFLERWDEAKLAREAAREARLGIEGRAQAGARGKAN